MTECIFCKIASGEVPCAKLFENDRYVAFLDINPANHGHTLVIPKAHVETIVGMEKSAYQDMAGIVHTLSKAILKGVRCDGLNILMNNKESAGQEVPHAHIHIIPRLETDTFKLNWPQTPYPAGEIDKVKAEIKRFL